MLSSLPRFAVHCNTSHMERRSSTKTELAMLCGFLAATALVACTTSPPSPREESTSTTPGRASPIAASGSTCPLPESSGPGYVDKSAPPPAVISDFRAHANGGTVLLRVEAPNLSAQAICTGYAQNTGTVQSGGGSLGGAAIGLGSVSASNVNELSLLPGEYMLEIHCTSGTNVWEGQGAAVTVTRDKNTELVISLIRLAQ